MSVPQKPLESSGAWEYRRAFVLPEGALPAELPGDRLVECIETLEASQSAGCAVVRVKLSADDQGRSWFDVLVKRSAAAAEQSEPQPGESCSNPPLRIVRAA